MRGDELIARWRKAYKAYNHLPAPEITCSYGWYRICSGLSLPFRHWKLERMVAVLEERAGIMSRKKRPDLVIADDYQGD